MDEPSDGLPTFAAWMHYFIGTLVRKSVLSCFFKIAFPFRAGLYQPNLIHFDEFCPDNHERAMEDFHIVFKINPYQLKGQRWKESEREGGVQLESTKESIDWGDPTSADKLWLYQHLLAYRFCEIDQRSSPVFCNVHEVVYDTTEFSVSIELACALGFIHHQDVLILDDASIHSQGNNAVLDDWLREHYGVLVLFLPPWSPELNPIELMWNTMVKCLKNVPLIELCNIGAHRSAVKAHNILE